MKFALIFVALIFFACVLSACDVFYDVRYVPTGNTNAKLTTTTAVSTATLVVDLNNFAQKYKLKCTENVRPGQIYGCYSDFFSKINGGFFVETDNGHPFIHFFSAHSDGLDFFSKTKYCAGVTKLRTLLEEFTGPLEMQVSNENDNYNFCSR